MIIKGVNDHIERKHWTEQVPGNRQIEPQHCMVHECSSNWSIKSHQTLQVLWFPFVQHNIIVALLQVSITLSIAFPIQLDGSAESSMISVCFSKLILLNNFQHGLSRAFEFLAAGAFEKVFFVVVRTLAFDHGARFVTSAHGIGQFLETSLELEFQLHRGGCRGHAGART